MSSEKPSARQEASAAPWPRRGRSVSEPTSRMAKVWIYGTSIAVHLLIAAFAMVAPLPEKPPVPVAITVAEFAVEPEPPPIEEPPPAPEPEPEVPPEPEPEPPPPPPPPPKPAPEPPPPPPAAAPEPPPAQEAAPSEAPAFADLGLVMGGGGPGGVAVPSGRPARQREAPSKQAAAAARKAPPSCTEEPTRARPKKVVPPTYTPEARQAEIEGPVRIEVTIDEEGRVTRARVVRGLGYGLDEAAVAAAQGMLFEPSRRCGKAIASTLAFNMRFTLDS